MDSEELLEILLGDSVTDVLNKEVRFLPFLLDSLGVGIRAGKAESTTLELHVVHLRETIIKVSLIGE